MKRIKTLAATLAFAAVFHGLMPEWADACPTCKLPLHNCTALGYAIGILFMITMPSVFFGFWTVTILRLRARHREFDSKPTA
jgi:hypothetical protein